MTGSLPYPGGDRIVALERTLYQGRVSFPPSPDLVDSARAEARSLEAIATFRSMGWTLTDGGDAEQVRGDEIGPELAGFLGARPLLGRLFTADDALLGAAPVALVSEGLWRRRFGARKDVIGRSVTLDGRSQTVIGVMPRDFGRWILGDFDARQVFTPLIRTRGIAFLQAVGRLRPGVTLAEATRELTAMAAARTSMAGAYAPGARVRPVRAYEVERYGTALRILFGAVGLVLLIACANVANLFLVRARSREREFAVRTAIGAGRGRLVRQLLTESVALSLAGGTLGAMVAWRAVPLVIAMRPSLMGFLLDARVDGSALVFTAALAILTGLVFGLAPALFAVGPAAGSALRTNPGGAGGRSGRHPYRGALIVTEVALSAVLLIGAGLLVRSLIARVRTDAFYFPKGLASFRIDLPYSRFPSTASRADILGRIVDRIRGIPGVEAVSLATASPWTRNAYLASALEIEGRLLSPRGQPVQLGYDEVQPDYFRAVGASLQAGRIMSSDTSEHEAVVSQAFVRRFFPSGGALGARLRLGPTSPWLSVVGVVGDIPLPGQTSSPIQEILYAPAADALFPTGGTSAEAGLVIRMANAAAVLPFVTRSIVALDSSVVVGRVDPVTEALARAHSEPRFIMTLLSGFAALALAIAAVGLYGIVAYAVRERTHEIGVRVALGADAGSVLALVIRHSLRLAVLGIGIGLAGAAAATRLIRSQLYGVGPADPATFAAVGVALAVVALAASWVPARAALRVDPVEALRYE